ncbi:MAG: hypothetical protein CFE26_08260 [Verrucomicrobiales bacterium VVV1]|nr:MAG: hypothetical protein CFE26_08260 [Verrucomicrobiales bacterium VVV1]
MEEPSRADRPRRRHRAEAYLRREHLVHRTHRRTRRDGHEPRPIPTMRRTITLLASLLVAFSAVTSAQTPEAKASTPAITRIAFLGDSITAGVGVKDSARERYSTVATRLLAGPRAAITEINLGQSGRALCQQNAGYAESVLKQNPDTVVIQWGVNDQYWGFSVAEFVARYDALVATLRLAKPQMPVVVMTLIADFRLAENQDAWIGEANIALQEIAARHRCHLADTHRAIDHQKTFYADTVHPNTAGAELMAKTLVTALHAQPLSPENAAVSFDQGNEVRFLQNVFLPKREGVEPQWIHVSDINSKGMSIEGRLPIAIRTAPIYPAGKYRITIQDRSGTVVDTIASDVGWSKMQSFTFDPKGHDGPFRIEIMLEKSAGKQAVIDIQ